MAECLNDLNEWLTSPSINGSAPTVATVVDVVVVVVVVVLFAFGALPKINDVALSAWALPTIPIMAEIESECKEKWLGNQLIMQCNSIRHSETSVH